MSPTIIEKLLNGAEVEWKPLGEVCDLKRGRVISKQYLAERSGQYPVYSSQTANQGKIGTLDTYDFDGEFINWTTDGANAGTVFYRNGKFSLTNVSGLINVINNSVLNCKYLFYWLTIEAKYHVYTGMGNPKLMSHQVKAIPIPIPPVSVQKEIVRILDAFTAHTAELTAELNERKKQYNYYRDKLLTFSDDEVEWKPLGEVCEFSYGYVAKAQARGDTRFIRISDINNSGKLLTKDAKYIDLTTQNKKFVLKKGDLLMARTGATFGKTMYFNEGYRAIYAGFLIKINFLKKQILNKFYWHVAQSKFFWDQANRLVSGGGQPQFNVNVLKNVIIPVPSIEQQKRIVSILDKFDALTTSISEGLPREIELRNKQYEYYRDQLLNFPKPENDAIKHNSTNR